MKQPLQLKPKTKTQAACFLHSYPCPPKHMKCLWCAKTETCTTKATLVEARISNSLRRTRDAGVLHK